MSNYDKLVKGATKPKQELPKPKYMHPILAAPATSEHALQSVFRSLSYRLQDPSSTVVFKTLIVVHSLLRSKNSFTVLSYLAGDPSALRLQRAATGGLMEYTYSKTLARYATYLESRIVAFNELGYDVVQASQRDRFTKLRKMSVSKGLLREIALIQRVMKSALECSFFTEEVQDPLTLSALQMTLKDMLAHYMGMNEGIINMLQHYFDMNARDAERSLELYRRFAWQTERVVSFLDMARRASPVLREAIPHLNHAPLELAGALEDYLNDPNFDKNREEYKRNREQRSGSRTAAQNSKASGTAPVQREVEQAQHLDKDAAPQKEPSAPASTKPNLSAFDDFFESLEQPNNTPFQAAYASFSGFNAQPDWYGMQMTPTGGYAAFGAQPTGFNPFAPMGMMPTGAMPMMQQQATGHNPFGMQPMHTGQAPLMPQHTMATTPFDSIFGQRSMTSGAQTRNASFSVPTQGTMQAQSTGMHTAMPVQKEPTGMPTEHTAFSRPEATQRNVSLSEPPKESPAPAPARLKTQKTGSMNPFSIPSDFEEPVPVVQQPKQPSLNDMARNAWAGTQIQSEELEPSAQSNLAPQQTGMLSSIASEFARPQAPNSAQGPVQLPAQSTNLANAFSAPEQQANALDVGALSHTGAPRDSQSGAIMGAQATELNSGAPRLQSESIGPQLTGLSNLSSSLGTNLPNLHTGLGRAQGLGAQPTNLRLGSFSSSSTGLGAQHPVLGAQHPVLGTGRSSSISSVGQFGAQGQQSLQMGLRSPLGTGASGLQAQATGLGHAAFSPTGQSTLPATLAGIKPFEPSSTFGHSLFNQQTTGTPAPTQDLLQL
ncbi:hypothetical protein MVES1_003295 [Malassezia vespertilionis]|uniref:ENTH domain-containing protein n=1 Tax=Malassezia vespertilionis TaxID=2020962 RepID=A0A2N1J6U4_9BASI|nr:uncharacterized protein MVES1_003295 [Malassezia vespertilionis]PKI82285.1 hypothetical protein MVES_003798 [Malassezia vespertilionis]WFD07926.1 hypothetical protein MVES1_003295 [Malassezia vespertilionis]